MRSSAQEYERGAEGRGGGVDVERDEELFAGNGRGDAYPLDAGGREAI